MIEIYKDKYNNLGNKKVNRMTNDEWIELYKDR